MADDVTSNEILGTKYNVLKQFRTYSYHHILIVTNTTEFVAEINSASPLTLKPNTPNSTTSPYSHPPGEARGTHKTSKNGNKFVVLVNTETDSNIIFNDIESHSFIGGSAGGFVQATSALGDVFTDTITMNIFEPFGSRFVEFLLAGCNDLKISQSQAILVLKTVFVGHVGGGTYDGDIESIMNYNAFPFMIHNLTFNFSSSGTTYVLNGLPLSNGYGHLAAVSSVRNINSITSSGNLEDFVTRFNELLTANRLEDQSNGRVGRQVVRKVALHDDYKGSSYELSSRVQNSVKGADPYEFAYAFDNDSTIHRVLLGVVGFCPKIQQQMTHEFKVDEITAEITKPEIHSMVTQTEVTDTNGQISTITTITYTLHPVKHTVFKDIETADSKRAENRKNREEAYSAGGEDGRKKELAAFTKKQTDQNNLVEYDYIFSGKNDDVIDMNMTFEFGIGTLYNDVITPQPTSLEGATSSPPASGSSNVSNSFIGGAHTLPSFGGSNPFKDPGSYFDFQKLLRRYSAFETMAAEITVMGNPRLFANQVGTSPAEFNKSRPGDKVDNITPEQYARYGISYAKINVFMPTVNANSLFVDFSSEDYAKAKDETIEQGFKQAFWYDGLFHVMEITNLFQSGKFTQKLLLFQVTTAGSTPSRYDVYAPPSTPLQDGKSGDVEQKTALAAGVGGRKYTLPAIVVAGGTDGGTGNSNVSAFLKTIRYCEGSYKPGIPIHLDNGYKKIVNGHSIPKTDARFAHRYQQNQVALKSNNIVNSATGIPIKPTDAIASGYSSARAFNSYSNHPYFYVTLKSLSEVPNQEETSAAGAYQIVSRTWDGRNKKDIPDFSPLSQDKYAVKLLEGKKLLALVAKGQIRKVLADSGLAREWSSMGPNPPLKDNTYQPYVDPESIIKIYVKNGGTLANDDLHPPGLANQIPI